MTKLTWSDVVQILLALFGGGSIFVIAVKSVWKLVSQADRIDDVHGELARAYKDRDYFRDLLEKERASHDSLKKHWKSSVMAQREARRIEESLAGSPSVPPLSGDEPTGRFFVNEDSDQEWRRQSEEKRIRLAREAEEISRKYMEDMHTTPPEGFDRPKR
jgi:hypothetical protein